MKNHEITRFCGLFLRNNPRVIIFHRACYTSLESSGQELSIGIQHGHTLVTHSPPGVKNREKPVLRVIFGK